MALFNKEENKQYRYCVASCIVMVGGDATILNPLSVVGIHIMNDYMASLFPIFKLNIATNNDLYYKVNQNKTNTKIKLRIQKYAVHEDGSYSAKSDWINNTFVLIDDDTDVNRSKDNQRSVKRFNVDNGLNDFENSLELYLYREDVINGVKGHCREAICDVASVTDIVGYVLGESGLTRNVLMSPLENNGAYKDIHIPPISIHRLVMHFDAYYGFYRSGSIVFFGIERSYILNFKGGCTALAPGELPDVCFLVPKENSAELHLSGVVDKNDLKNYIVLPYGKVAFTKTSITDNVTTGAGAMINHPSSGASSSARGNTVNVGSGNSDIITAGSDNPWLASAFAAQATSKADVMTCTITDFDVSVLTPNKRYSVIFEDTAETKKHKGAYLLASSTIEFINDRGEGDFQITAGLELRRSQSS